MTKNNLALPQKVIVMRNGIQIWTDAQKAERFEADWRAGMKASVGFEGRSLNSVDILGVFYPEDIEDLTRRKNGQWKCSSSTWHDRGERCFCLSKDEERFSEMRKEVIKKCGKCRDGCVYTERGTVAYCSCVIDFEESYGK